MNTDIKHIFIVKLVMITKSVSVHTVPTYFRILFAANSSANREKLIIIACVLTLFKEAFSSIYNMN